MYFIKIEDLRKTIFTEHDIDNFTSYLWSYNNYKE